MDLGVGSFVFSSGLVSSRQPNTSVGKQLLTAFRSSAVILSLGIIRMVLTKAVDYQVQLFLSSSDLSEGTCHGIRSALEFFHYFGITTAICYSLACIQAKGSAVFCLCSLDYGGI